jgi:signal transduction histidine kinase
MQNPAQSDGMYQTSLKRTGAVPYEPTSSNRHEHPTEVVEDTTFWQKTDVSKKLNSTSRSELDWGIQELNQIKQEIIQVILSSSNSRPLLNDMAQKIGEFFRVEACAVVGNGLDSLSSQIIGWWHGTQFSPDEKNQFLRHLLQTKFKADAIDKFGLTSGTESHAFHFGQNSIQEVLPSKTLLATTTKYREKINGAIFLLQSQSYQWTNSEQELLEKISESMAIAISQIQLQQHTQTKTRYQALLNHLSQEISQSSDPDLIFDTCLTQIGKTLEIDQGTILMFKYQDPLRTQRTRQQLVRGKVKIACQWTARNPNSSYKGKSFFNLKDSQLCQQAWQLAPQCLAIPELVAFPDLSPEQLPDDLESQSSALLMMPLMGKKTSETQSPLVLGFLVLQYNVPHLWQQDELDLINWISVQISTAIIHHQTLNQVQSIVEERTAQLKWSLDVQAKLSEKMRQQIEQLQQLNQLKDDFLNSMSHELKTPLTSMKMAIKMLRQAQLPSAMRERYLNILEQEWEREYNLIKDLLTLQQVESGELIYSPQQLNLRQTIEQLTASFTEKWHSYKGLTLTTQISNSAVNVYTDSESLEHILNELLLNAGKYSDADTTIELSVSNQDTLKIKDKMIAIAIANYGAGIPTEELPYIFDKFRRGKGVTDRAVPGTGLGLTLVKHLVDHLNGTIDVTSEPVDDCGLYLTTFTVKLPQF